MENKMRILLVDDEPNNLFILSEILMDDYELVVALSGDDALELARQEPAPDLILLDVVMPQMTGYEVCTKLKADETTMDIPVVFVTSKDEVEDEAKGFAVGAVDYITKPVSPSVVRARVATHIELAHQQFVCKMHLKQRHSDIIQGQKDAIFMLGQAGHYNDDDTGAHIWRMASYSRLLAKHAGWTVEKQNELLLAAPMHDTGKLGIPDSILKKPGKLTPEEWTTMQKHSQYGYDILSIGKSTVFKMASEIALYHHERWTGGGYPENIQGENIPESARIVAIADVFDALTTRRPYKEAWSVERAMDYIANSDGHFEPRLVDVFLPLKDELLEIKEHWGKKESTLLQ